LRARILRISKEVRKLLFLILILRFCSSLSGYRPWDISSGHAVEACLGYDKSGCPRIPLYQLASSPGHNNHQQSFHASNWLGCELCCVQLPLWLGTFQYCRGGKQVVNSDPFTWTQSYCDPEILKSYICLFADLRWLIFHDNRCFATRQILGGFNTIKASNFYLDIAFCSCNFWAFGCQT
jgi:hypothetical protein